MGLLVNTVLFLLIFFKIALYATIAQWCNAQKDAFFNVRTPCHK